MIHSYLLIYILHTSHVKVSKNDNKKQTMKNVLQFRINVIFPVFSCICTFITNMKIFANELFPKKFSSISYNFLNALKFQFFYPKNNFLNRGVFFIIVNSKYDVII